MSAQEIDEFITELSQTHPEYSVEKFKNDFESAVGCAASLKQINLFIKLARNTLQKAGTAGTFPVSGDAARGSEERTRTENLPMEFLPNPFAKNVTKQGNSLSWDRDNWRTFFVDPEMNEGIYKIVIERTAFSNGYIQFGIVLKNSLNIGSDIHSLREFSGSCFIGHDGIYVDENKVAEKNFFTPRGMVTLGLELDARMHTLHFFVDGTQIPYCIVGVPPSMRFAVAIGYQGNSAKLISHTRLAAPSIDASLECAQYNWRRL